MNTRRHIIRFIPPPRLIVALACLIGANADAADYFHLGRKDGARIDSAKEYSNTDGDTTPAAIDPGEGDDLYFYNSAAPATSGLTLYAGAGRERRSKGFNSMTFRSNSSAIQIDRGANFDSDATVVTIGAGGITMDAGAGPVTFGRPADSENNQRVIVGAVADFSIANNSDNDLTFNRVFDGRSESTTHTVTVTGSGSGNTVFVEGIRMASRQGRANRTGEDLAMTINTSGTGVVKFEGTNNYTGATSITAGKLFINGDASAATGQVVVSGGAILGGKGIIGGDVKIADNGGLEFAIGSPAEGHNPMELQAGLAFDGASALTITSSGGVPVGKYTLLSANGGISGNPPATLNLPEGWKGEATIAGKNLILNLTSIGAP